MYGLDIVSASFIFENLNKSVYCCAGALVGALGVGGVVSS